MSLYASEEHMHVTPIYQEIVDFLAVETTPTQIIAFCPSKKAKERIAYLLHKEKNGTLS